ncbi:hypothetical protein KIW84_060326 [Lathyrus oleraceus]|uniref:Ubiquitin-like protease family profile domain-containing protein n=1 Tax=Pisum sativum TaxID=3888 RepID=A0A9D5A0T8_PEA|nr:hypothetical protein KIW84_060326 [Pisum sativum]
MSRKVDSVKDINDSKETWRLAVRIMDVWSVVNNKGIEHLEMIVMDSLGDRIQVLIRHDHLLKWKEVIKENMTCIINNGSVYNNDFQWKVCDHSKKIVFLGGTTMKAIELQNIPPKGYFFKDFGEILQGKCKTDRLEDIIGAVSEINHIQSNTPGKKVVVSVVLKDLKGNCINCNLWEIYGSKFLAYYNDPKNNGAIVILLTHAMVKYGQVSNAWSGSKLLINEDIPEIQDFMSKLPTNEQKEKPTQSAKSLSNWSGGSQYSPVERFVHNAKCMSLSQFCKIKHETLCVTVATTLKFAVSKYGWFYYGCTRCSSKAPNPEKAYECSCGQKVEQPIPRAVDSLVLGQLILLCVRAVDSFVMASNEDHPHGDETVGVPITCDNWRNKQLNEAKDKIWSEIKRCFDIEENRRDHCLKLAGKLLRGFRTFLSTTFLRDTEGTFVDAELPSKYASLISPKEWETFKSKRKTQEFKSVSETNRQRASSPAYPYRKGRVGYGRLEQSILTKENSSETSLPAHVLWKEARVGKDGKIKEDVQQIFEKCETLSQSIVPYEDTDCRSILSRALDVPEYSGRVRGKGFGITQKSLNIKKQKTPSNKELQQTLEALKAEVLELRKERERDRAAGFKDTSDKDSINCNFQPTIPEGISPCHLYLARPTYRMVGKGKVHNNLGELLHTKPLPTGSLKVSVDIALEKDALLPHPDDVSDATLLGDAIGSFVAWPTDLIIVGYETPTKSKAKDKGIAREIESVASQKEIPVAKKTEISKRTGAKKKNPSKYRACLHTYLETTDISDGCVRLIPMDGAIFGFEYAEPLGKEDFDQILYHTQLSVGVINTYMRYLYDKLMGPRGLEQRFSFLNPMKTNLTEMIRKPDEVRTYVVERFMADTDREKLFFLPFNTGDGGHWLLVAINPFKEIVYYLDSLHKDWTTYPAMKTIVDTIIQTVRAQRKIQVPKRKANNITWNRVECPRQRNNIDCGYYTLRFMKETLLMDRTDIPSDYFDEYRCAYYSKDQLDEIKEELCQFIIELQVL